MDTQSERTGLRPDLRYELKLACDAEAHGELRMALRLDRAGIRQAYPPRRVQSLYLDTADQRNLRANLDGLSRREKIRFRWYGAATRGVRGTLEHKCRENSLGWKGVWPIAAPIDVEGVGRNEFVAELARHADPLWRARLEHGLEPAQWVYYEREYYEAAGRRVRLTLDRGLTFADQRLRAYLSDAVHSLAPRILVLEVKCAPEHHDEAREIVGRLPIPIGRCSKFVLASEPSEGPLASILMV